MAFQIKDFNSIVLAQINHARGVTQRVTDFQPGSVVRTLMEAPAVEIEELYLQMFLGLRDAIPVATFLSFGFEKIPAKRAIGWVSILTDLTPEEDTPIPAGSVFRATDGRIYTSIEDTVWPAGEVLVRVQVQYEAAGAVGNIAAGLITVSEQFSDDAYTVSNSAITTGKNTETDLEREARFAEFVRSLSRGTVAACMYAVKQAKLLDADGNVFEYVTLAGVVEEPGYVRIYAYTNRGLPSAQLLALARDAIDGSRDPATGAITPGYRAAGVRVDVLPVTERAVPMAIRLQMAEGYSYTPEVEQALGDVYASVVRAVQPGASLYLGKLVEAMLAVPGVSWIEPLVNSNIVCGAYEALIPGALTVTLL